MEKMQKFDRIALDFGIQTLRYGFSTLNYQFNRQLDFNEWYDDVYIVKNKDAGSHCIKLLWELFEKYENEILTPF